MKNVAGMRRSYDQIQQNSKKIENCVGIITSPIILSYTWLYTMYFY